MHFLFNMAVNHTVIRSDLEDGSIELTASSPDEQAFVSGSYCLGVEFLKLDNETNTIHLNVLGKKQEVRILQVIPYESSRKRMSVIVEMPDGSINVFIKVCSINQSITHSFTHSFTFPHSLTHSPTQIIPRERIASC